ncbi:MAG: hypothetical protein WC250_02955, partial [Candidatus Paceibacterota bacterium]
MIELATTLTLLVSTLYGSPVASAEGIASVSSEPQAIVSPITLEDHVKEYFKDAPIMAEIAKCESTYRQLTKDGRILRGEVNRADVGVMQINEFYHAKQAKEMGFDIKTLDGNLAYAKWLYE